MIVKALRYAAALALFIGVMVLFTLGVLLLLGTVALVVLGLLSHIESLSTAPVTGTLGMLCLLAAYGIYRALAAFGGKRGSDSPGFEVRPVGPRPVLPPDSDHPPATRGTDG